MTADVPDNLDQRPEFRGDDVCLAPQVKAELNQSKKNWPQREAGTSLKYCDDRGSAYTETD